MLPSGLHLYGQTQQAAPAHAMAKHNNSDLLAGVHQQADYLLLADIQHVAELYGLSPVLLGEGRKLQEA